MENPTPMPKLVNANQGITGYEVIPKGGGRRPGMNKKRRNVCPTLSAGALKSGKLLLWAR
jgi:hypothetical protein